MLWFIIPLQFFVDLDNNPATGYGAGYEIVIRLGVAYHTEGGGGPGGWGPLYEEPFSVYGKRVFIEQYTWDHIAWWSPGPTTWWSYVFPKWTDLNRDGIVSIEDLHANLGLYAYYVLQQELD